MLGEELERERGKELTEKSQKSFADPEARMMKTGDGSLQYAYNAKMAAIEDGLKTLRKKRQRSLVAAGRETMNPTRWPKERETQRMHRTLRLHWAKQRYGKRKTQGERPFAKIKAVMGFRRFGLRGVSKVGGERDLMRAALNLRRLNVLLEPTR